MIKKIGLGVLGFFLGTVLLGYGANILVLRLIPSLLGMYEGKIADITLLFRADTYLYGAVFSFCLPRCLQGPRPAAQRR